jgi:hypothetical protein
MIHPLNATALKSVAVVHKVTDSLLKKVYYFLSIDQYLPFINKKSPAISPGPESVCDS